MTLALSRSAHHRSSCASASASCLFSLSVTDSTLPGRLSQPRASFHPTVTSSRCPKIPPPLFTLYRGVTSPGWSSQSAATSAACVSLVR